MSRGEPLEARAGGEVCVYFDNNRRCWDARVEPHTQSDFYDMKSFMAGKSSLTEIERDALGDVTGKTLLHLQCHFGQDTLSWARQGARVTGVDFSEKAIEKARVISQELGLESKFVSSNVYDLPNVLDGEFDFVFTSYGALTWLPDLENWATIVRNYLKPGAVFFLAEFHPTLYLFNFDNHKVEYGYFSEKEPYCEDTTESYTGDILESPGKEYFWSHSIDEIVSPLINRGLTLVELREYDYSPYKISSNMVERETGRFVWGTKFGVRIPHVLTLKMTVPCSD